MAICFGSLLGYLPTLLMLYTEKVSEFLLAHFELDLNRLVLMYSNIVRGVVVDFPCRKLDVVRHFLLQFRLTVNSCKLD